MKHSLAFLRRWSFLVLAVTAIIVIRIGMLPAKAALFLAATGEIITLFVGGVRTWQAVRRIQRSRRGGANVWDALTDGIAVFVPRPVARIIAFEPRIWASIFTWLFRRPRANATTFPYTQDSVMGFFIIAVLFSAPVEALVVDLLVPWGWLKFALALLEVYTVVWLLGYAASLAVLPHRLHADALELHYGLLLDATIPLTQIASITRERRSSPTGREGYFCDAAKGELALVVGGVTNITLTLRAPQIFSGLLRPTPPIQTIALKVDEPERFVAAIAACITAPSSLPALAVR